MPFRPNQAVVWLRPRGQHHYTHQIAGRNVRPLKAVVVNTLPLAVQIRITVGKLAGMVVSVLPEHLYDIAEWAAVEAQCRRGRTGIVIAE